MRSPKTLLQSGFRLSLFYEESLIFRYLGWVRIGRRRLFNDQVEALKKNALGMFFYNQRAVVFGGSLGLLLALWIASLLESIAWRELLLLSSLWVAGVASTLVFHGHFRSKLAIWESRPTTSDLWPLFDGYFLLDSLLLSFLLLFGYLMNLHVHSFVFLLLANTVVYVAYVSGARQVSHKITVLIFILLGVGVLITLANDLAARPDSRSSLSRLIIDTSPLAGTFLVTILSILVISKLRTSQHEATRRHLELLGRYERMLSQPSRATPGFQYDERVYRLLLKDVVRSLCSNESNFWYSSACFWFLESHRDKGLLLLPGPSVRFGRRPLYRHGVSAPSTIQEWSVPLVRHILHQLPSNATEQEVLLHEFAPQVGVPGALIPIRFEENFVGVLALYGKKTGPPIQPHESEFLASLATIVANTMQQWRGRFVALAQQEMNNLFSCESFDTVFSQAAELLQKYLMAAGCMIVFRPEPKEPDMKIAAARGFKSRIYESRHSVGVGKTGECALTGEIIRYDDVSRYRSDFDPVLFDILESSHRKPIRSWMAIPIGRPQHNYGVIKVVNSTFRCSWFTDFDEELGRNLAVRLHVIIDRFLHVERTETATKRAQGHAREAVLAKQRALQMAHERQEDLMVITHQLQGALISVTGALTAIDLPSLGAEDQELIEHAEALVQDAIALAYGTSTTFAKEAGREISFGTSEINAPQELKSLAERLRKTNPRDDEVTFSYSEDRGFPIIALDDAVFTSVMYSLIHNALKYSDPGSEIVLECSFERETGEAALKVKSIGEPILPGEADTIFQKFRRGRNVEKGRHHRGVGLGLWVARELMMAVGGNLTVELSHKYPRLSVFVVHLPKAET